MLAALTVLQSRSGTCFLRPTKAAQLGRVHPSDNQSLVRVRHRKGKDKRTNCPTLERLPSTCIDDPEECDGGPAEGRCCPPLCRQGRCCNGSPRQCRRYWESRRSYLPLEVTVPLPLTIRQPFSPFLRQECDTVILWIDL